ncbi:methyltransferase [Bacillus lacus]|uniref:tRNA 5-hydroxyuridine methyltransferase n=1 Tax=Metabacillus lacus TaxID=1983721 RepID=A0A7X2LXJ5_9BACI|nr:O-methyltransferase [Metabacillus lacus]MRX71361.1 methyltransferase [Metabacillus lacus]
MITRQLAGYLESLLPEQKGHLKEMENYAVEHEVPIMEKTGIDVMLQLLRLHSSQHILEIGAAIGYSASRMALALPDAAILTIEKDAQRYTEATYNIQKLNLSNRVSVLHGDALETAEQAGSHGSFDVLFIDAAKGQYRRFFEMYEPLLSDGGMILTDNVLFKGLVAEEEVCIESKRIRSLVKKIKSYNEWLMNHPDYITTIIPVGDGLAVSMKR